MFRWLRRKRNRPERTVSPKVVPLDFDAREAIALLESMIDTIKLDGPPESLAIVIVHENHRISTGFDNYGHQFLLMGAVANLQHQIQITKSRAIRGQVRECLDD